MAHILFLTQILPYPLDAGPKVRAYHILSHLAQQHTVTLVSFIRPDDPDSAIAHLRQVCREVYCVPIKRSLWYNVRAAVKGLTTGLPILIARDEMPEMTDLLRQLLKERRFDAIHADQTAMAGYGQWTAGNASGYTPRTLLDQHNAVHLLADRMAEQEPRALPRLVMKREARAFARFEANLCHLYDAIITVTPQDREHLLGLLPPFQQAALASKFTVIPISVDTDHTSPLTHQPAPQPTIVHLGTMFWPPNVEGILWFVRAVLPVVWQQRPEARLIIIGKNPPPSVQTLTADPRIQVTGYLADPTPHLQAADVFIVPLHAGSGMRVKILDAWLWGLPIVSTATGAEGIETRPGQNILLADSPAAFAQAVLQLLSDPALNHRLRQQGRTWVETHYSVDAVYRKVDDVYDRLLQQVPASV